MASFTTRVQLDGNPPESDYEALHAEMRKAGFTRFIQNSSTKKWYRLPHAEYNRIGELTRKQVLDSAIAATKAAVPLRKRKIFVTESNGRSWDGLDEVTAETVRNG
jgi:hypothetical protein